MPTAPPKAVSENLRFYKIRVDAAAMQTERSSLNQVTIDVDQLVQAELKLPDFFL